MWFRILLPLLVLTATVSVNYCKGWRENTRLNVRLEIPKYPKVGDGVVLVCKYDIGTDTLYAVKWYKGNGEFYRYTPKELPAVKIFGFRELVDERHSNATHLILRRVDLNMSGKYSCEVTTDSPDFTTDLKTEYLTVIAIPPSKPELTKLKSRYSVGDFLNVTCFVLRSRPAANLTWYINERPAHLEATLRLEKTRAHSLENSAMTLGLTLKSIYFVNGRMNLRCTASIYDKYSQSSEVTVFEDHRPKISSVVENSSTQAHPQQHNVNNNSNKSSVTYFLNSVFLISLIYIK